MRHSSRGIGAPCMPLLIVLSSMESMLYGAGRWTGGRLHVQGGRHMETKDWDGLTVCARAGTVLGSSHWRATSSSCMMRCESSTQNERRHHCRRAQTKSCGGIRGRQ
jgi:hypothetical protein